MKGISFITFVAAIFIPLFTQAQIVKPHHNLNETEASLVAKFQDENNGLLNDGLFRSDSFAIGILRGNKWNTEAGSKYLKKLLAWRVSNEIAKLGESAADPKLLKSFYYQVTAFGKNGCPVTEIDGGNWVVVDFMRSQEFVRDALKMFNTHTTQMFEKSRYAINKLSPQCDQGLMVISMKNMTSAKTYAETNAINGLIRMVTTLESYYPYAFKNIIIINTNQDFTKLLEIVLPAFGQTAKDLRVFSEDEDEKARKQINEYIEPEKLSFY